MYEVRRVLNNNAVLAWSTVASCEVILIGRGLGFKTAVGDVVKDVSRVEKEFYLLDGNMVAQYMELIETVEPEILSCATEFSLRAGQRLGDLQSSLVVLLSAHLSYAVYRVRQGIVITNPLFREIEILYPQETALALEAVALIRNQLDVEVGDQEAGYIALHLSAARLEQSAKTPLRVTNIINSMVLSLEQMSSKSLRSPDTYTDLLHLLRMSVRRAENVIIPDNPMLWEIERNLRPEYEMVRVLDKILFNQLQIHFSPEELGILAFELHILLQSAPEK